METVKDDFDVAIVGAGPAGTSAAIHLASRGARVALAEQKQFPRHKLCGEFISPECLAHFERLGAFDSMARGGGREVLQTEFYTRAGRSVAVQSEWFGDGSGRAALGLSRAEMDARLLERARAAGVNVLEQATATNLVREDGGRVRGVELQLAGGARLVWRAGVTIDATGRARSLSRRVGRAARRAAGEVVKRAPLVAFKAHLEGARGAEGVCEIYFYKGGYGGLSPVEGGLSNLCFIVRSSDVRAAGSDAERVMREVLMKNRRAAETLRGARARTEWLGVALESFGRRDLVPAEGLLSVGDAASFIDPFTGSGMLMALESGELAAEAIAAWLARVRDGCPPEFAALARDYGARYAERFDARLRLCGWLRRAAFAPQAFAEAAILALGASERLRRRLARATRQSAASISA
ncbi:MAG TPA: NAD(P)/FAD-dependent oxidoreductase [Pyrinomonadaceae bacterium]|nr:NAD(P)/FAD-dependent oxidoreductase [Pyrinomonadaceae bacterium]